MGKQREAGELKEFALLLPCGTISEKTG